MAGGPREDVEVTVSTSKRCQSVIHGKSAPQGILAQRFRIMAGEGPPSGR